ncbi:MAG: nucleotidyltransferase domain-containing protein [Vampirovibrionia bacterium]
MIFNDKKKKFLIDTKHIAHGTQIVTLIDKVKDNIKYKSGRTGVIIDSEEKSNTYVVKFSNDCLLNYERNEITIRKLEIDNFIQNFSPENKDLKEHIIYECIVGSKAFGLADNNSDNDVRGIYLAPNDLLHSLWGAPEQLEDKKEDKIYWELEKFIRLALKGNPNILETMWSPLINYKSDLADQLIEIREIFLSKHIFNTYGGYTISQFNKMNNEYKSTEKYRTKHALHLIRLLISGTEALKHGYIMIDVSEYRNTLLSIKKGEFSFTEVEELRKELELKFNEAYENTKLPDYPDVKKANDFLILARKNTQ